MNSDEGVVMMIPVAPNSDGSSACIPCHGWNWFLISMFALLGVAFVLFLHWNVRKSTHNKIKILFYYSVRKTKQKKKKRNEKKRKEKKRKEKNESRSSFVSNILLFFFFFFFEKYTK